MQQKEDKISVTNCRKIGGQAAASTSLYLVKKTQRHFQSHLATLVLPTSQNKPINFTFNRQSIIVPIFLEGLLVKVTHMLYGFIFGILWFELGRTFPL